ncbi:hypothetical protein OKW43_001639 [Paraburkholderia sp. WC7.3g]
MLDAATTAHESPIFIRPSGAAVQTHAPKGDFATDTRLLRITVIAAVVGLFSTFVADFLLHLISFFTNLFFFQTLSTAGRSPASHTLGLWVIVVPVVGGLIVGLLARFGSEQIRGHGIPEAIEAILFGKSTMSPKVAVLKPLASAIAIGSGGPFGAEGLIIMTGGRARFVDRAVLPSVERRTQDAAGGGRGRWHDRGVRHARRRRVARGRTAAIRIAAAQFAARCGFVRGGGLFAAAIAGQRPAISIADLAARHARARVVRARGADRRRAVVGIVDVALQGRGRGTRAGTIPAHFAISRQEFGVGRTS